MKKIKILFTLLVISILLIANNTNIKAFNSEIGPVQTGNEGNYNGYDYMPFKKASNKAVFCTMFHLAIPSSRCSLLNDWSDPVKAGVATIINEAQASNSNMTENYYYAELAINQFLYYYNGRQTDNRISSSRSTNEILGSYKERYYDKAVREYYRVNGYEDVSLTRTYGKSSYNLSNDDSNNILTKYRINGTDGINYTVSASFTTRSSTSITAKIMDENGTEKNTFSNGDIFQVKVSNINEGDNAQVKIDVTGNFTYNIAANYNCGTAQTITPNEIEAVSVPSSVYTKITIHKEEDTPLPKLVIKKLDNNSHPLKGAEISLIKDDIVIERIKDDSDNAEITFEDLEAGHYCIQETKAPIGYNVIKTPKCFNVTIENNTVNIIPEGSNFNISDTTPKVITLLLYNSPNLVIIEKEDENGNQLSGVQFSIRKIDYSYATTIDGVALDNHNTNLLTTGSKIKIRGLAPGNYYLVEESVPNGYAKSQPIPFTVKDNTTLDETDAEANTNTTVKLVMQNKPTVLNINKLDIINRQSIKDAELEIRDENCENVIELNGEPVRWKSNGQAHSIIGLTAGRNYCLKETKAPNDYKIINDEIKFYIDEYGAVKINNHIQKNATVIMENEHKIYISKTDLTSGNEIEGAHLQLLDENNNVIEEWISSTEKYYIKAQLTTGTYKLKETIAPEGYVLSEEEIVFTVNKDGSITVNNEKAKDSLIIMTNDYTKVYISKQDITTKEELPGAHLVLKNQDGDIVKDGDWVSTTEPHLIEGLKEGTYTLTEITAPDGYQLNEETITFTVDKNGVVSGNTVMYNTPIPEVPNTLSTQSIIITLLGLLIVGSGIGLYIYGIKKKKEI